MPAAIEAGQWLSPETTLKLVWNKFVRRREDWL
jgi:hypothetical protein